MTFLSRDASLVTDSTREVVQLVILLNNQQLPVIFAEGLSRYLTNTEGKVLKISKVNFLGEHAPVASDAKREVGQLSILFQHRQLPVIFDLRMSR